MNNLLNLKDVYKSHRELVLIGIVGRYYDKVYFSKISDIAGSLSVADFFSDFVDSLMEESEYTMALKYAMNTENRLSVSGNVWEFYHIVFQTSLDWYYFDKAEKTIDKFISEYKN